MGSPDRDDAYARRQAHIARAINRLERLAENGTKGGHRLTGVRFKLDADEGMSVLCILTATGGENGHVAFVGGIDLSTTLLAVEKRLAAGKLRWRESKPWGD